MKKEFFGGIAALTIVTIVALYVHNNTNNTQLDTLLTNVEALAYIPPDDPYAAACKAVCTANPAYDCVCEYSGGTVTTVYDYKIKR